MNKIPVVFFLIVALFSTAMADLPPPLGWVSDYAGLLGNNESRQLNGILSSIKSSTGAEIAVVTQNSLDGFGSIEEMGLAYLEGWGVGRKGIDDGLVILVVVDNSIDYKGYRFETGYGLEGDLPDGLLGQIAREELVPRFQAGDYGGGILAAVLRIGNITGADLDVAPPGRPGRKRSGIGSIIFFIILFLLLVSRRGRGSGLLWLFLLGGLAGPRRSAGGFGGGSFGGGSFGGFGGGGGGGGGASGSW
jgi:uncharacterized protein